MGRPEGSAASQSRSGSGANLDVQKKLWVAADRMRLDMNAAD
jgi:hypothetical protein